MRTLMLVPHKNLYYFPECGSEKVEIYEVFPENQGKNRELMSKLMKKFAPRFLPIFFSDWYKLLKKKQYDQIVLMSDVRFSDPMIFDRLDVIARQQGIPISIYCWNLITNPVAEKQLLKLKERFPIYHYDRNMCKKYGFSFNTIMYAREYAQRQLGKTTDVTWDIFFLGFAKDREKNLINLHKVIEKSGAATEFLILGSQEKSYSPFSYIEKYLSYPEYIEKIMKSRAILDVIQEGQDGFSMRVMEAIFLDKKIISTNTALLSAPFYKSEGILVFTEHTTPEDVKEFMDKKFDGFGEEWKDYYSLEKWAERFMVSEISEVNSDE